MRVPSLLVLITFISNLTAQSAVADWSNSATEPVDARAQLVTLAETGAKAPSIDEVRRLVESYRIDRVNSFLPLRRAPYPRFLLNAQMGEIYPAVYESELNAFLNEIPLELLFDGVIDMIIDEKVPAAMEKQLKDIDPRLAARVKQGKSVDCPLDESEATEDVSKFALILVKFDYLHAFSSCTTRRRIYNAAKPDLIKARKTPEVKAMVKEAAKDKFPQEFRTGFLAKINGLIDGFPTHVSQKFGAGKVLHPIWSELGSVIEADIGDGRAVDFRDPFRTITLKSFSQGLLADLYAANVLLGSSKPRDRSLAAGLFYAVVNRWLYLTGGVAADWDDQRAEMPIAVPGKGKETPKFREVAFGGWGAEEHGFGVEMSSWGNWSYSPSDAKNPSPLRLFPTRFEIDRNGVGRIENPWDAYQTNEDLAYLLLAVTEFLKATQPGMPLAKFFGGKDQVGDLLDPTKPMLFPTEGRMIAVGVLAAVAQNLLHPTIGHVGSKSEGIPIYFRDRGSFGPLKETDVDTRGVCSVLVAASKLNKVLRVDPVLNAEPALKTILPEIGKLVQISALVVGKAQDFNGAIRAKMASQDPATNLGAQIAAIRVFLAALNASETPEKSIFVMARLVPALQYLFAEYFQDLSKLDLEARMNLTAVWNQSQSALRSIRPELPWAEWEQKIRSISEK